VQITVETAVVLQVHNQRATSKSQQYPGIMTYITKPDNSVFAFRGNFLKNDVNRVFHKHLCKKTAVKELSRVKKSELNFYDVVLAGKIHRRTRRDTILIRFPFRPGISG
jgi:hypothetical protein